MSDIRFFSESIPPKNGEDDGMFTSSANLSQRRPCFPFAAGRKLFLCLFGVWLCAAAPSALAQTVATGATGDCTWSITGALTIGNSVTTIGDEAFRDCSDTLNVP
ncbi:MAG: hypothetical protein LBS03_05800 [Bacteroidales bacterium]|jgi:hypothetical protein|nr:hypothetical protein [Bacteroidales bacterium]